MSRIIGLHARQILDSRGQPTVEVDVSLEDGTMGRASVPSGASTGTHEALELRDKGQAYSGKSVAQAVAHVNDDIARFLKDWDANDQVGIDNELVLRDGTPNLQRFGSNAILGVSLAVSRAAACSHQLSYFEYVSKICEQVCQPPPQKYELPRPMFNILNGGVHTDWQSTDIQEFQIIPLTAKSFAEQLQWGAEVYHALKTVLRKRGYSTLVGDEGGFAPHVRSDDEAIEAILEAIGVAGYKAGEQIALGIDGAMSELYEQGEYRLRLQHKTLKSDQVITMWQDRLRQYPIISLEDGLAEDDWTGWSELTRQIGQYVQIVGDDLLVTNLERIQKAIDTKACNALLMKPNQIGTLTESLQAIALAKSAGWKVIVSHRSGETEDTSIADIAVGANAGQIKAGALARGERLAKYNQLLRIEEFLHTRK